MEYARRVGLKELLRSQSFPQMAVFWGLQKLWYNYITKEAREVLTFASFVYAK